METILSTSSRPQVVVALPFFRDRVLMQLRDQIPGIHFPGHWGYFGGSIHPGESPRDAVLRELSEEIGLVDVPRSGIHSLGPVQIEDHQGLVSEAFYFDLVEEAPPGKVMEGLDYAFVGLGQLKERWIDAPRLGRRFPLAATSYIEYCFRRALDRRGSVDFSLTGP